jgi:hypothetical protein
MPAAARAHARPVRLAAVALAAAALATVAPAAARAATPWSPPAAVPGLPPGTPALAFNEAGVGVLATDAGGGDAPGAVGPHTLAALADDDDAFSGPAFAITATNVALADRFALYGLQRIVGLGTHFSSRRDRAGLVFGDAGAKLTDVRVRGPADRESVGEALAASARGDVAATFGVCVNAACIHQSLSLIVRRAGGSPRPSIRLDGAAVGQISAVAVNARGDALAVWRTDRGVFARIRTAGGTLFRAERLGDPGQPVRAISAVLTPDRAAAVVWEAQAVSEGDPESAATVDATFKAPGARHHFHASQRLATVPRLSTGHYVSGRAVRAVLGTDGRITAAWTAYENGRFVVRAAGLNGGFRFAGAQRLSDPAADSILADLAAGPNSGLAVAWATGIGGHDPGAGTPALVTAPRVPGATTFGPAEVVEQGTAPVDATVRFNPSTGRAVAAWDGGPAIETSVRPPLALAPPGG